MIPTLHSFRGMGQTRDRPNPASHDTKSLNLGLEDRFYGSVQSEVSRLSDSPNDSHHRGVNTTRTPSGMLCRVVICRYNSPAISFSRSLTDRCWPPLNS